MAFKMKGFSLFGKKKDKNKVKHDEEKYPTSPLKPGEGKPYTGTAPIVGGFGKLFKTFGRIAKSRATQSKAIQKMLEKKGKKFISSPKSTSRGNLFKPGK